ncbi:MAG: S9 family peptidase [Pirellulaceae bacterium]|nr:S9 family peptidase [Pirellulaceae bacterium]
MRIFLLSLGGAIMLAAAFAPAADETRPFSVHDMLAMERISDWQVSPDGRLAVFGVSTADLEANRRRNRLWMIGTDGAGLKPLTSAAGGDAHPRWMPDGRSVLFLSSRSGSSQVWRIAVDGGEAEQVTRLPLDVGSFAISPDGLLLALSLEVFPDGDTLASTVERLDAEKARKSSGRVYEQLMIRHWDTWRDGRRSHLFVLPLVGGDAIDLMRGMDADAPSKPFGGAEEYTFTPDSTGVVFTAKDDGREEAWTTNYDLWHVPVDGSAVPRRLTADNLAWDTHPVFSPDGKTLAYLAMSRPGYESDRLRIVLRQWPDGPSRVLADDWDRSPEDIVWSADGRTIYATAANLGQVSLFAVDVASGSVRTVVEQGRVRGPRVAGGKLLFGLDDLQSPVELYTAAVDGTQRRQITRINAPNVARSRMGAAEQFTFPGWNGETVYAYVVKPVDFDPAKKYPVAFLIHGGPQGSFGNTFHYRWNPQVYAGRGYASVMVDFHGSVGYGQAFTDSIGGDWGGKPLVDLQKGLAAALERYPWMDGDRVGALGASYGGYMINWIAGQWPDRFRCLVSHDGNLDERAAYFMTEELWFPEWEHRGTPWDNPAGYAKHNPVDHVDKWQTPMLVIHGALDFRVVETAGMATFTALQRRGIPSKFLYFPDENHWVLKPHNSIQWHDTVLDWLDRWLQPTMP